MIVFRAVGEVQQGFDEFGSVAAVTLPDGAKLAFPHDELPQLRDIIDPAGAEWIRDYDLNGQLAASIDPTGVRTDVLRSPGSP